MSFIKDRTKYIKERGQPLIPREGNQIKEVLKGKPQFLFFEFYFFCDIIWLRGLYIQVYYHLCLIKQENLLITKPNLNIFKPFHAKYINIFVKEHVIYMFGFRDVSKETDQDFVPKNSLNPKYRLIQEMMKFYFDPENFVPKIIFFCICSCQLLLL